MHPSDRLVKSPGPREEITHHNVVEEDIVAQFAMVHEALLEATENGVKAKWLVLDVEIKRMQKLLDDFRKRCRMEGGSSRAWKQTLHGR